MKIAGTRTFLEVRVGAALQSAEVVLHVRRADISWFNNDSKGNDYVVFQELLELLQASVLPRMFADEIEANNNAKTRHANQPLPPELGPGGIPVTVGEKNSAAAAKKKNAAAPHGAAKRQRVMSKAKQAALKRLAQEAERQRRSNEKDVYYAASAHIQIAYRLEDISSSRSSSATLLFGREANGSCCQLKKLSKRILLWCYPISLDNDKGIVPTDEGFARPEFIPMASIFRAHKEDAEEEEEVQVLKQVVFAIDD